MSLPENSAELIRVGTLNVGDMPEHLPDRASNMAAELARMQFGVVGLQEVTATHAAAIAAELPNHKRHFEPVYGHDRSGLMTLVDQDVFRHSESYRPNGRLSDSALLVTELTTHGGDEIVFVTEHQPQEVYLELERIKRKILLAKYLKQRYSKKPVVKASDTNSTKAAPLNLLTQLVGYRSAHKEIHGREPYRTYPSGFGDELLSSRVDGKPYEVIASRALRRVGNMLRSIHILDDDDWDSPHAGCDVDRVTVNELVEIDDAGIFADDRQKRLRRISDHVGVWASVGVCQTAKRLSS